MQQAFLSYAEAWIVALVLVFVVGLILLSAAIPHHMPDSKGIGGIAASNSIRDCFRQCFDCITSKRERKHEHNLR
jgi:hypothetical protein